MAKVVDPGGAGAVGQVFIIDSLGRVRKYVKPKDPRTEEQLKFRQLMRGLYTVLIYFCDGVDDDLRAKSDPTWQWSACTFQQWAFNHGNAINSDLPYYGKSYR